MKLNIKNLPSATVLVSIILVIFVALTWVIPAGEFQRQSVDVNGHSREVIVPGTFSYVESTQENISFGQKLIHSIETIFTAPIKGFTDPQAVEIICFVLFIGGAFAIFTKTGAMDAGMQRALFAVGDNPRNKKIVIAMLITLFSLAGSTFGMAEECLIFILITLPMARSMGYDNITGIAIPFVGSGVGFAAAFVNPFTLQIAQGISGLQPMSGTPLRLVIWAVFTIVAIFFILRYTSKLDKNPKLSPVYGVKYEGEEDHASVQKVELTGRRGVILVLFVGAIGVMIYGVSILGWYIMEMTALFLAFGVLAGLISGMSANDIGSEFTKGASEMFSAALLIGMSRGLLIIAEDGKIIDTMLNWVAKAAEGLPAWISVQVMFLMQTAINFFIPSGSGKAALTMPIMAPLADILGITRQSAVLAYQFGDGITNLIIPTSGITLGILQIARVPFGVWIKWSFRLILGLSLVAMAFLAYAVLTNYN